ncbi:MAG TPA: hypothetical protein VGD43_13305 [Micromonospora sp.]
MDEPRRSGEHFTDDEYAFLRHVRFGELPQPVRPEARSASIETDPPRDWPDPLGDRAEWALRMGGS